MARNKAWTSEDWIYASELLVGLSQTLPPVLGTAAQLTYTVGKATAEHEMRMRELEAHEARMRHLMHHPIEQEPEHYPAPVKRRPRR